jgi:hypothetical protein
VDSDEGELAAREKWYYELGGRVHGPLSWAALEELFSHSAETAAEARIRKGLDGDWVPFRSGGFPGGAPARAGTLPSGDQGLDGLAQPTGPVRWQAPGAPSPRKWLRGHTDIVAAVGLWILFNVLFALFWPQPYARERRYLVALQRIAAEVQELRAQPATEPEWREFRMRCNAELSPMVKDLEKSASSAELVRQQLLWSARDLLPRTFGPRTKDRDAKERQLKEYLDSVDRTLGGM